MWHRVIDILSGNATQLRIAADEVEKIEAGLVQLFASRTGQPPSATKSWFGDRDCIFTPEAALCAGLVHELLPAG